MTDLIPRILELWTLERELREAGKWPEGVPGLVVHGGYAINAYKLDLLLAQQPQLIQMHTDAALWRIMQFVAWWSWHRSELLEKHVNESYWFAATPADWITAAKKILEGWG